MGPSFIATLFNAFPILIFVRDCCKVQKNKMYFLREWEYGEGDLNGLHACRGSVQVNAKSTRALKSKYHARLK